LEELFRSVLLKIIHSLGTGVAQYNVQATGLTTGVRFLKGTMKGFLSFFLPSSEKIWGPPSSYLMCIVGSFPGGKATGEWSWPITSI